MEKKWTPPKRRPGRDIKGRAIAARRSPRIPLAGEELAQAIKQCVRYALLYCARRRFEEGFRAIDQALRNTRLLVEDWGDDIDSAVLELRRLAVRDLVIRSDLPMHDKYLAMPFEEAWLDNSGLGTEDAIDVMNAAAEQLARSQNFDIPGDVLRSMRLTSRGLRKRRGDDEISWRQTEIRRRGARLIGSAADLVDGVRLARIELARWESHHEDERIEREAEQIRVQEREHIRLLAKQISRGLAQVDDLRESALAESQEDRGVPELAPAWADLLSDIRRAREILEAARADAERAELPAPMIQSA